jgi:hypothetical protein
VAQDQRVEFLFAAQVSGNEQLQKLITSVDSLRKETEQLKSANTGLTSSTDAVIRNGVRYNNAIDAQSKSLRQARQGTQQLGMQINDFATSVSTGASPVQAFNQQIGQVGIAMSQMGGAAGKVGAFLAGPWGAALVIGTMAVSALWAMMNQAPEVNEKFAAALERSRDALFEYQITLAKTREEVLALYETKLAGLQFEFQRSATEAGKFGRKMQESQNVLDNWRTQPLLKVGKAMYVNSVSTGKYNEATTKTLEINTEMIRLQNTLAQMRKRHAKEDSAESAKALRAAESAASKLQAKGDAELNQANQIAEKIRDLALVYGATGKEAGTTAKKLDDFNDMVKKLGTLNGGPAILKELGGSIELVRKGIEDDGAKKALSDLNQEMDNLVKKDLSPFEQRVSSLMEKLSAAGGLDKLDPANKEKFKVSYTAAANVDFDTALESQRDLLNKALGVDDAFQMQVVSLEQIIERMVALGIPTDAMVAKLKEFQALNEDTKMAERNRELQDSFEAIGTAVSNSFKGMITGAMSFSSAMKGIISSVIDELIRLYVVQQIVGVVKNALGSIGLPVPTIPGKAIGGSVGKNTPYMVGEQGPELFIPGGSGTIIPNRNLSSSVENIIADVSKAMGEMFNFDRSQGDGENGISFNIPTPTMPSFDLTGKAIGGSVGKNTPYMVGEQGPELFIPGGSGTIIPNRNLSSSGGGSSFNITVDARGSNDPAAVRAQVQQGILEAAPAIIAAAESRTVAGLRRPRLGGVMQ